MDTHATGRAAGTNLMKYIVLIAVIGILLLQLTGSIPLSSVGGPLVIGLALSSQHWLSGSTRHGRRNGVCLAGS